MAVARRRQSMIETPTEPLGGTRPPGAPSATPDRLLDTAERLFVAHGYERVTARMINAEAGCNPAAIHYHFGSKEALVVALLEDRLMRHWPQYTHGFRELEQRPDPTVEEVVSLAVLPLAQRVAEGGAAQVHVHLLARVFLGDWDAQWQSKYFDYEPWLVVLERAMPGVDTDELRARWNLASRLNLTILGDPLASRIRPRTVDVGALIAFLDAGIRSTSRS
jgi:AcrR family transcriptional regulator